jgi:hypothetical protein
VAVGVTIAAGVPSCVGVKIAVGVDVGVAVPISVGTAVGDILFSLLPQAAIAIILSSNIRFSNNNPILLRDNLFSTVDTSG